MVHEALPVVKAVEHRLPNPQVVLYVSDSRGASALWHKSQCVLATWSRHGPLRRRRTCKSIPTFTAFITCRETGEYRGRLTENVVPALHIHPFSMLSNTVALGYSPLPKSMASVTG